MMTYAEEDMETLIIAAEVKSAKIKSNDLCLSSHNARVMMEVEEDIVTLGMSLC